MKTFHGFSPLSVATLFVAALVLPIVLFPFGSALLMNFIFIYGFKNYRENINKSFCFEAILAIFFVNLIFIIVILFYSFRFSYELVLHSALIGNWMRQVPGGDDFFIFKINALASLFVANPLIVWHYTLGFDQLNDARKQANSRPSPVAMIFCVYFAFIGTSFLIFLYYIESNMGISKETQGQSVFVFRSDRQQALFLVVISVGLCYVGVIRELMTYRRSNGDL